MARLHSIIAQNMFTTVHVSLRSVPRRHPIEVRASAAPPNAPCVLKLGYSNIPHPAKESYGGEDAFFISHVGGGALGVADGVGGWAEDGVNPAEYSQEFMRIAKEFLEGRLNVSDASDASVTQQTVMAANAGVDWVKEEEEMGGDQSQYEGNGRENALDERKGEEASSMKSTGLATETEIENASARAALAMAHLLTRKPGSATACVIRVDPESRQLEAANLGDCGFLIIRNGDVVFKSPIQQHFFDCPYQFGSVPEFVEDSDTAEDADVFKLGVQEGDVVVLATDGLLDNVWPEDIAALAPKNGEGVSIAAMRMAKLAYQHALDASYESPYAAAASEAGIDVAGISFWETLSRISIAGGMVEIKPRKVRGGKLDDITVVVGFLESQNEEKEEMGDERLRESEASTSGLAADDDGSVA